jgi:hypothetical protein
MDIKEAELKIYSAVTRNGPVLALRNKVFKLRLPCKFLRQFNDCRLYNKDVASQRQFTLQFVNTSQKNVLLMHDMVHLIQVTFPTS